MLSKEDNDLITRTDNGAVLGQLMRRYWLPALLSEEIPERDGRPVRVRILGEELVAFRDSEGRIGLLGEHCSHRGTSLFFGRNEEKGLTCIYHGWKYDVEGNVLDTPAEPDRSVIRDKVKHLSYPTHEVAGIIWAYLGPREKTPLFPNYRFTQAPKENVYVTKVLLECNWLQGLEGECDTAHVAIMHHGAQKFGRGKPVLQDLAAEYETEETDFGVRMIATRTQPDPKEHYVRVSSFVMPVEVWVPVFNREIHMYVPINDTRTWRYDLGYLNRPVKPEDVHRRSSIGPDYRKIPNLSNDYLQDPDMMRTQNFTGIKEIMVQDACVTETMSYSGIFDRTKERLGVSDKAVITVRNYLLRTVKAFERGEEPPHIITDPAKNDMTYIDSVHEVFPAEESWREHWPYLTKEGSR